MTAPFGGNVPGSLADLQFAPGLEVFSRYRRARRIERTINVVNRTKLIVDDVVERFESNIEFFGPRPRLPVDIRADDFFHIWARGEFLDLLAQRFYTDPSLWWIIADFNNITEVRTVDPGRVLRLPNQRRLLLEIAPLLR